MIMAIYAQYNILCLFGQFIGYSTSSTFIDAKILCHKKHRKTTIWKTIERQNLLEQTYGKEKLLWRYT